MAIFSDTLRAEGWLVMSAGERHGWCWREKERKEKEREEKKREEEEKNLQIAIRCLWDLFD